MSVSNFSSLAGLEHTFLVRSGQVGSDDGYSDDRAISVQLGWDLTELGNKMAIETKKNKLNKINAMNNIVPLLS